MYERMEKYVVRPIEGRGYEVVGQFKDDIHDIRTRVVFDYFTYKVVEAQADINSLPFEICKTAVQKISSLVGVEAGPGFRARVKERIGGSSGCIHLVEMMSNSLKAALQGASRQIPDWVEEEDYKRRWDMWDDFYRNTCIYFSQPNALQGLMDKVHENKLGVKKTKE